MRRRTATPVESWEERLIIATGTEIPFQSETNSLRLQTEAGVHYTARSEAPLPAGKHKIEVITDIAGPAKGGKVKLQVDGQEVGATELKRTVPAAFSASETFDVGADLGSTVSLEYSEKRPFEFIGRINKVSVELPH